MAQLNSIQLHWAFQIILLKNTSSNKPRPKGKNISKNKLISVYNIAI